MGYLWKSEVMESLREDKETSLMCYDDEAAREIVKFCYDSMEYKLEQLRLGEVCVVVPEVVAYLQMGDDERIPDYRCPICGYGVADDYVSCPHCGGVLNWEDVEAPSEEIFRNLTSTDTYDSDFSLEEIKEQTEEHFKRMLEEQNKI